VACAIPEEELTAEILSSFSKLGLWSLFNAEGLVFIVVVIRPGQALYASCFIVSNWLLIIMFDRMMPPGVRHTVGTPVRRHKRPSPAIVFGFLFYSRHCMEAALYNGIQFALWWEDWSNDSHDDFAISVARMLAWQGAFPQREGPFRGRNLFALICMGKMVGLLKSQRSSEQWDGVSEDKAQQLADAVILRLDEEQLERFKAFQSDIHAFYKNQWEGHRQQRRQY